MKSASNEMEENNKQQIKNKKRPNLCFLTYLLFCLLHNYKKKKYMDKTDPAYIEGLNPEKH